MTGSGGTAAKQMAQDRTLDTLGGKRVSDLISTDIRIAVSGGPDAPVGAVTGTVKYVKDWEAFSSDPAERSGNFFPLVLDSKYQGQEITCTGPSGKVKKAHDLEWVIRLSNGTASEVTFKQEETQIIKLTFSGATLENSGG